MMSKLTDRIRESVTMGHFVDPTDEQAAMVFNTEVLFQMLDNLFKGVNFLIWLVGLGTLLAGAPHLACGSWNPACRCHWRV